MTDAQELGSARVLDVGRAASLAALDVAAPADLGTALAALRDDGSFVDALAGVLGADALDPDGSQRQRLLGTDDVRARIELADELVRAALARFDGTRNH